MQQPVTLSLDVPTLVDTLAKLAVHDEAHEAHAPHVAPTTIFSLEYDTTHARKQWKRVIKDVARAWKRWHKKQIAQRVMSGSDVCQAPMNDEARQQAIAELRLRNVGLPKQRTDAWYVMREKRITASDFGKLLKMKEATLINYALDKAASIRLQLDNPVKARALRANRRTGASCQHGTLYEPACDAVYRNICRVGVVTCDLGLMAHPSLPFLGASPDGLCTASTSTPHDVGRLVEYKAPTSRALVHGTVPEAYLVQMQGQLEVAGLDECDYLECKFEPLTELEANALFARCAMATHDRHGQTMPHALGVLVAFPDDDPRETRVVMTRLPPPPNATNVVHADHVDTTLLQSLTDADRAVVSLHYWALTDYQMLTVRRNREWWTNTMLPVLQHTHAIIDRFTNDVDAFDEACSARVQRKRKKTASP